MKRISRAALLLLLAVFAAGGFGSTAADPPTYDEEMAPSDAAAGRVLELRKQLGLRDDQVNRLKEIRKRVREQNAPLTEQIHAAIGKPPSPDEMRRMSDTERAEWRKTRKAQWEQHPELKPIQEQRRAHLQTARDEAMAVLDADQRAKLEKLLAERKAGRKGGQGGQGGNRKGSPGGATP